MFPDRRRSSLGDVIGISEEEERRPMWKSVWLCRMGEITCVEHSNTVTQNTVTV